MSTSGLITIRLIGKQLFPFSRWLGLLFIAIFILMGKKSATAQVKGHFDPSAQRYIPSDPSFHIGPFDHGYAVVKNADKMGVIRQDGSLAMPIEQVVALLPIAADPDKQPGSMPPAKANFGIIMVKEQDPFALPNSICVQRGLGLYFLCTPDGRLVLPYLLIWSGKHQFTTMCKPGGMIYFQRYDDSVEDDQFCQRCGLCLGFMGILQEDGSMVIAPDKYVQINDFHEGLASVKDATGKFGYVDQQGCEVIPCKFSEASDFEGGAAWVKQAGKRFQIGSDGKKRQ